MCIPMPVAGELRVAANAHLKSLVTVLLWA